MTFGFFVGLICGIAASSIVFGLLYERAQRQSFNAGYLRGARDTKAKLVRGAIGDSRFTGTYS